MEKQLKYAIVGVGAIGGYYGGALARAGKDVHFLLHSDYEHVVEHGLQVDSRDGNYHLSRINAYDDTALMPACDVVIVSMKTTQNALLPTMLPPLLKSDTVVVLIQNGIGVEPDLHQQLPQAQLAAGLAFICSGKVGPGHINHQYYGDLTLAPYSIADNQRLALVADDMRSAGLRVGINTNYLQARWRKAVWNIPFNGLTVALDTSTDQLMCHPSTERLLLDLMAETIEAANAISPDVGIDMGYADKMMAYTRTMPPYSPSMKLDFERHHPMELRYLYHRPVEDARRAGYDMRKVKMLADELEFIQHASTARRT